MRKENVATVRYNVYNMSLPDAKIYKIYNTYKKWHDNKNKQVTEAEKPQLKKPNSELHDH